MIKVTRCLIRRIWRTFRYINTIVGEKLLQSKCCVRMKPFFQIYEHFFLTLWFNFVFVDSHKFSYHSNTESVVFSNNLFLHFLRFLNAIFTILNVLTPLLNLLCHSNTRARDKQSFSQTVVSIWKNVVGFLCNYNKNLKLARCSNFKLGILSAFYRKYHQTKRRFRINWKS